MQRQYSFDEPPSYANPPQPQHSLPQQHSPSLIPLNPAAHPDSAFNRLRAQRRYSQQRDTNTAAYSAAPQQTPVSPISPPQPPPHRDAEGRFWGQELGYAAEPVNITPGADNFGDRAAGGMTGIALSVADANARESGLEAMRNTPGYDPRMEGRPQQQGFDPRLQQDLDPRAQQQQFDPRMENNHSPEQFDPRMNNLNCDPRGINQPIHYDQGQQFDPRMNQQQFDPRMEQGHFDPRMAGGVEGFEHGMDSPYGYEEPPYAARPVGRQDVSSTSLTPLGAAAFPPGIATPQSRSVVSRSPASFAHEPYVDNPYHQRWSRNLDPNLAEIDPNSIEDDGDDGLEYRSHHNRGSMLSLGHNSDRNIAPVAGAAAAGGVLGALGGAFGKRSSTTAAGTVYDAVHDSNSYDLGPDGPEKSAWLKKEASSKKRMRLIIISVLVFLVIGGIAGGIVGGLLSNNKKGSSSSSNSSVSGASAATDSATNGDLNKDSAEIKKLLNNANLHKVFPGIDYTPMYTQYPDCLSYPPSQNNVTRDLAVLSQLTNTIRLYGTDCNQTEMVLHSIDQLGLNGTIKVWMGVWQDTNATTNARQLSQMYDIFSKHGSSSFAGVIVGNEVLFREDMTITQLTSVITGVKSNLTSMGISVPIASSDLGDNWTAALAAEVDIVMANIHPFFAGVTADVAASWTWDFWQSHDVILKTGLSNNYISETGWPSKGGMDCGGATTCTNGSVAGITEMNTFMEGWVCDALSNGTNYFWFEAFDEPWKIKYDTTGKEWEDQWGLMDVNRNLKSGVSIPSCGGKTVS